MKSRSGSRVGDSGSFLDMISYHNFCPDRNTKFPKIPPDRSFGWIRRFFELRIVFRIKFSGWLRWEVQGVKLKHITFFIIAWGWINRNRVCASALPCPYKTTIGQCLDDCTNNMVNSSLLLLLSQGAGVDSSVFFVSPLLPKLTLFELPATTSRKI